MTTACRIAAPVATILALLSGPVLAQSSTVTVDNAWARATSASQTVGGIFLRLTDSGPSDHLVSVSSPIAPTIELHETVKEGGVMRMRPVPNLELRSGEPVELKPGGYHLMVMGLKQPMVAGSSFPLTLTFEKAPPVTTTVQVGTAGASEAPMDHGAMKMPMPSKP